MKAHHRKTHWVHTVFSIFILGVLTALIVIKNDIPTLVLAGLFGVYVAGNGLIHAHRDDFKPEVLVEYILLAAAVFIVLASALRA
jgi:hypothetical protein